MEGAPMWDTLWLDGHLATMAPGTDAYGTMRDGAIAAKDGRIAWVGARADLPGPPEALAGRVERLGGSWVTPGLIDCHTHLVFGGDRVGEWEQRLEGVPYAEIAKAGGGIARSVALTRAASEEALFASAMARLSPLLAEGVTTVEVKSGYGLDLESELKMLRVARRIGQEGGVRVRTTLLAAHALPPEYKDDRAGYIDLVCQTIIPAAARDGLADAVDAFCEGIAFTVEEVERVFTAAQAHGLPVKLHADQLSDTGGAALAARFGALSADHIEYTGDAGLDAMAAAGTVAVLLPGAFYLLRERQAPDVVGMRARGIPMAVATDLNPGTSPARSLLLMLNMACTLFRLTPAEALAGATRHAATALGLADEVGTLEVGKACDLAIWEVGQPAELAYWLGGTRCVGRVVGGVGVG
ncbi:imidazolonepropionase [Aerophototrophica crusticola]|uniref:Imidazolonepropionase n=1 Tax=Aerophototrophica crusticola TaxID=1709002 RepID=A0A858R8T3_9PROT|nr:imidazolonepropionase [Rhodospirillaceae bacterium B3]